MNRAEAMNQGTWEGSRDGRSVTPPMYRHPLTSPRKARIVAYLRSDLRGAELEMQKRAIVDYAEQRGLGIDRFYEAVGESSFSVTQGYSISEVISSLKSGDELIITEPFVLSHKGSDLIKVFNEMEQRGAVIHIVAYN
jgi:DNA invertase Pin-like site-specific DNA recombinase